MAVIKHFLEEPCTRGSNKFRTSTAHQTVPRSYRRAIGIGLYDQTAEHAACERALIDTYATITPKAIRARGSDRAQGPATDQAAQETGPNGSVNDARSGMPLRGREAKLSTVPVLGAMAGTTASLASPSTATAATAGQLQSTLKSHSGMLRTRAEVHVSARVRNRRQGWLGL